MSIEVGLNTDDYNTILSWYQSLFGPGKIKETKKDIITRYKITVMAQAFIDEMIFLKEMGKGED